jgi:hypothetical protein
VAVQRGGLVADDRTGVSRVSTPGTGSNASSLSQGLASSTQATPLSHPVLIEQNSYLGVELIVAHPLGDDVGVRGRE